MFFRKSNASSGKLGVGDPVPYRFTGLGLRRARRGPARSLASRAPGIRRLPAQIQEDLRDVHHPRWLADLAHGPGCMLRARCAAVRGFWRGAVRDVRPGHRLTNTAIFSLIPTP